MQLFAPRSLLGLAALLGASMVSAQEVLMQVSAKPMIVKSGGLVTATFEAVVLDLGDMRRRLEEGQGNKVHRGLKDGNSTDDSGLTVDVYAEFCNDGTSNCFDTRRALHFSNKTDEPKNKTHGDTKPGHSGKSTDNLQYKSANLFPNFKPRVKEVVSSFTGPGGEGTIVTWSVPIDQIVEGKKYTITLKLKVGPNAKSGDVYEVDFGTDITMDEEVFFVIK